MLDSPAKINLTLRVLGRRPDGYHDLDTWFQEVSLCDRIEFRPATQFSVAFGGTYSNVPEDNLVSRASRILAGHLQIQLSGKVFVHKEIPLGGGLGGGSSNAAATLLGLSRLWGAAIDPDSLNGLAAALGSDCPFFLRGGLARGTGRGEVLEAKTGAVAGTILLVIPPFGVSTARAFEKAQFHLTSNDKNAILGSCANSFDEAQVYPRALFNDLEPAVFAEYPELQTIRDRLVRTGAVESLLSGSGSTVFGIFENVRDAQAAASKFEPPLRTHICRGIARHRGFDS